MGIHGVFEVLVLVVVDPLFALPLLGLYPVGSCTQTQSHQALCTRRIQSMTHVVQPDPYSL